MAVEEVTILKDVFPFCGRFLLIGMRELSIALVRFMANVSELCGAQGVPVVSFHRASANGDFKKLISLLE